MALLVTMMALFALAMLGMNSLEAVMRDQQSTGFHARKRMAFHAADAGLSVAQADMTSGLVPTVVETLLGDAAHYPGGQPMFDVDPNAANPITNLGAVAAPGMNLRIEGGGPTFQVQYWRIQVQGTAAGGTVSRLEMAAGVLKGN